MNRFKCKHDWEIAADYTRTRGGETSSVLHCKKCGVNMTAHEVAELGLWRHTVGVQKWLSIGAILIALASLVISFLK